MESRDGPNLTEMSYEHRKTGYILKYMWLSVLAVVSSVLKRPVATILRSLSVFSQHHIIVPGSEYFHFKMPTLLQYKLHVLEGCMFGCTCMIIFPNKCFG